MCDCLIALPASTEAGVTLFAKNSDRPPDETQVLEWIPPRREQRVATTYRQIEGWSGDTIGCLISRPTWGWGAEHGVNAAGVAIGNEAIYTTLDPRAAEPSLTGLDLVRLGLERSASASDAVGVITSLLERYGQGGSGHDPNGAHGPKAYWSSFAIADRHEGFIVETSGAEWAVERVADTRAISNRTTIPAFDAVHRHPRQPVERFVDPRLAASRRALATRPVSRASLERHLASHDHAVEPGWSVCMHTVGEVTTSSIVAELGDQLEVWVSLGSPCTTPFRRISLTEFASQ